MTDILTLEERATGRGHFDVTFNDNRLVQDGAMWAAASEWDGTFSRPIDGGAHVTIQQVVALSRQAIVRVWVDNVPVNINIVVSLYFF